MNKSTQKVIDTLQKYMREDTLVWHNPCVMVARNDETIEPDENAQQAFSA